MGVKHLSIVGLLLLQGLLSACRTGGSSSATDVGLASSSEENRHSFLLQNSVPLDGNNGVSSFQSDSSSIGQATVSVPILESPVSVQTSVSADACEVFSTDGESGKLWSVVKESVSSQSQYGAPTAYNPEARTEVMGMGQAPMNSYATCGPTCETQDKEGEKKCRCEELTVRCLDLNGRPPGCSYKTCEIFVGEEHCKVLGFKDGDKKPQKDLEGLKPNFGDNPPPIGDIFATCMFRHEAVHGCQAGPEGNPNKFHCNEAEAFETSKACYREAVDRYCPENVPPDRESFCISLIKLLALDIASGTYTSCRCAGNSERTCFAACVDWLRRIELFPNNTEVFNRCDSVRRAYK